MNITSIERPEAWFCGKRSLEDFAVALKRSLVCFFRGNKIGDSVSSLGHALAARPRGQGPDRHLHESSCSLPQKATCGSFSPLLRQITSTCAPQFGGLAGLSSLFTPKQLLRLHAASSASRGIHNWLLLRVRRVDSRVKQTAMSRNLCQDGSAPTLIHERETRC